MLIHSENQKGSVYWVLEKIQQIFKNNAKGNDMPLLLINLGIAEPHKRKVSQNIAS